MVQRTVIGVSSGSSGQGIDVVLVEAQGVGTDLRPTSVHCLQRPYPSELRDLLWRLRSTQAPGPRHLAWLHRVLGEFFAAGVQQALEQHKLAPQQVWCVGLSGQPVWQEPEGRFPTLLTLGMPEVVAEKSGLTVLSDFHVRDLVAGGMGDPVTALVDSLLFRDAGEDRVLIHLGGLAQVLTLPAKGAVSAFPAAPCGRLLDGLMRHLTSGREAFDAWGKHAVQGRCIEPLLARWLSHPVLQRRPPRTLSWEEFGEAFLTQAIDQARALERNLHDLLCTATHFVAHAAMQAVTKFVPFRPGRVLVSGGGVRNGFLWRLLEEQCQPVPMDKLNLFGCPAEARKAVALGCLSLLALDGVPGNLPAATGAAGPRLLGTWTPGGSRNWARCLTWLAHQLAPLSAAA